ncbi:sterol desaturase family protein [uncultured Psychroserpens sp.]|uniref:sterol desaturase family protein n=1 Tax=uncultured Psychroserpens sp. TaxID=255436 RepID=UPI00260EF4AD|nr:sterol desaturase family protein [uncultured Psychroserpens sp.]
MKDIIMNLPSPLEIITDPISIVILIMYAFIMLWEALFPAKVLPQVKYWKLKGFIAFTIFFFLSTYFPLIWDAYLIHFQIFDLSILGTYTGAFVALIIYELGVYVWHRMMHRSNYLWRVFHQMHHSAERLDAYGAFYFSLMDMIGFTLLGSLCLVVIAGFTVEATTLFILITTFLAIFQHSNIKTPKWIGYIIQRPESHSVHHGKGTHAYNYSDLSFIDMIFGTFKNPTHFYKETGFYNGASNKVIEMFLFKDISQK